MKKKSNLFFNMIMILIIFIIIGLLLFFIKKSDEYKLTQKSFDQKLTAKSEDIICQNFKDCIMNLPKCAEEQIFECDTKKCITPEKCHPNLPNKIGISNLTKICSVLLNCDDDCVLENGSGVFRIKNKGKVDNNDKMIYLSLPNLNTNENVVTFEKNDDISSQLWYWDKEFSRLKFLANDSNDFYLTSYGDTIKGGSLYKSNVTTFKRNDSQRIMLEKTQNNNEFKIKFLNNNYLYRDPNSDSGKLVFTSSNDKYFEDDSFNIWIFEPIKCCSSLK